MNNKQVVILFSTVYLLILVCSCTEIIEPNISNEKVNLLAPADGLITDYSTQTFWWDEVVNANEYQLQVVTPDFNFIERLIIDTIIQYNKFSLSLYPAEYQWRVKALNYSYSTDFTIWSLTIDSTVDLTNQAVVLTNPINNDTTNNSSIFFSWGKMYNAESYIFQLDKNGSQIRNESLLENQYSENNLTDGSYVWRVKAINEISETSFFSRSFFIYTKSPEVPVLEIPVNNTEFGVNDLVQFTWIRDDESVPSISDNLKVASDSLFVQLVLDKELTNPNYESQFTNGVYFWKVKSTDKAGNTSEFSPSRKFIIYNN